MQEIVYNYYYKDFSLEVQKRLTQGYRVIPATISMSIQEKWANGDYRGCFLLFMEKPDPEVKNTRTQCPNRDDLPENHPWRESCVLHAGEKALSVGSCCVGCQKPFEYTPSGWKPCSS